MLKKRMATYHYKRKPMTAVLSLFLLSCSSSVVDKDESFNHPVFQSFADFCLPLANTEDGYSDENIKNFANLAKLQPGKLSESIIEIQPTAIYHSGDINNGS